MIELKNQLDSIFDEMENNLIWIEDEMYVYTYDLIRLGMEEDLYLFLRNVRMKFKYKLLIEKIGLVICDKPIFLMEYGLRAGFKHRRKSFKLFLNSLTNQLSLSFLLDILVNMLEVSK